MQNGILNDGSSQPLSPPSQPPSSSSIQEQNQYMHQQPQGYQQMSVPQYLQRAQPVYPVYSPSASQSNDISTTHAIYEQQFQDIQDSSPERQQAIKEFSNRLKLLSLGFLPLLFLLMFTLWWWVSFLFLTLFSCITVYYRASNNHRHTSVILLIILILLSELRTQVVIIFYFLQVTHLNAYEIIILVVAGIELLIVGPLCLYNAWWLHKSIQIDFSFLAQSYEEEQNTDDMVNITTP